MSRFLAVYEPVNEGWGLAIDYLFAGGFFTNDKAFNTVYYLLKNPKIRKYVKQQCDKLFADERKTVKDITTKLPRNITDAIKDGRTVKDITNGITLGFIFKNLCVNDNISGYTILAYGDTDHIERIYLALYSPSQNKCIGKIIPSPTDKELNDMGLRQEEG